MMLYNEFLKGTNAVDNKASYAEYKRVEQIYMESAHCTKEDAYRMAKVETVEQAKKRQKKEQKAELEWVKGNVYPAAAYVRAMSEIEDPCRIDFRYTSPLGNKYELKLVWTAGSAREYEFRANSKQLLSDKWIDGSNIPSYYAGWCDKSREDLEELFGYIA